ncbi:hypothetical protein ACODNH_07050 [Haloarcula sp. NS06]|uniref:hypothetical protein n=1 Tax=Haloarcula sp. NS06 TaxID=3409688 RepID=UPI003DA78CE5
MGDTPPRILKRDDRGQLKKRRARISTYNDNIAGVCIYLSPSDLELLGISVNEVSHIAYQIDQQNSTIDVKGTPKDETANQG